MSRVVFPVKVYAPSNSLTHEKKYAFNEKFMKFVCIQTDRRECCNATQSVSFYNPVSFPSGLVASLKTHIKSWSCPAECDSYKIYHNRNLKGDRCKNEKKICTQIHSRAEQKSKKTITNKCTTFEVCQFVYANFYEKKTFFCLFGVGVGHYIRFFFGEKCLLWKDLLEIVFSFLLTVVLLVFGNFNA
jgi:hypothetical protein